MFGLGADCRPFCIGRGGRQATPWSVAAATGAAVLAVTAVLAGVAVAVRNYAVRTRLSKGPNRVVLTASDFVFPQPADARRVSNMN